ncbi:MAG: acyl-CoA dehydratase activase, partial [Bacteroidales bacterium]
MQNSINSYKVGIDIGSTTAKAVVLNTSGEIVYSEYVRHNADIFVATTNVFKHIQEKFEDASLALTITGSAGMGLCERFTIPFVQEVVATARIAETYFTGVSTVIDIGGEDAKIIYIKKGKPAEMRMNGNCAGGTGAFIDQMSVLLNCSVEAMNTLAQQATSLYPIASRCGVFSKTDVQNLLSKNASKADIAASVFRAVAIQTIATLSHGSTIKPKLLFTGGPLTFIPALRKAFIDYLGLKEDDYISSERSPLIAAWGAADSKNGLRTTAKAICTLLANNHSTLQSNRLPAIFNNTDALLRFRQEKQNNTISHLSLSKGKIEAFLGIDSGSTTTKIVLIDAQEHILFSYYASNNGNPLEAAKTGIHTLAKECERVGTQLIIKGSCSTGYGEELVRAALSFNTSIIETIAHFTSAKKINPEVSFILDIGGQDMKAIFIDKGTISRMEINEACSSGCGSFIETFAKSLKYTVEDFASAAALAPNPCDLGTRCTVFMNSKVKQFLREGATVADIAAGLSYSVVKNCLYKVLKLKNISELGKHVVLQGGTMKNDSIVGAFEKLLGFSVYRSNIPELMGAYGCALYAKNHCTTNLDTTLEKMLSVSNYLVKSLRCQGCENKCQINEYKFGNANAYYSGNKCETVFSNNQNGKQKGENIYEQKYQKIFGGETPLMDNPVLTIGIPRVLNLYEEYPFWKELLTNCGIRCQLSDPSSFQAYENVLSTVMSDSICFPAKLVHSHIVNLSTKNIDRIFMPYVVYEMKDGKNETNSYNCPIVSGYSEVIRSSMD